jgi:hypothetical protein
LHHSAWQQAIPAKANNGSPTPVRASAGADAINSAMQVNLAVCHLIVRQSNLLGGHRENKLKEESIKGSRSDHF